MNSVRRTALIWMTLLLTLVGLVGAGIAYALDLSQADDLLDRQLRQIAVNAGQKPGANVRPASDARPEEEVVIQIWDRGGARIETSDPSLVIPRQSRSGFADAVVDGTEWRSYQTTEDGVTVQTSQRMSIRRTLAQTAALEAAIPILVTIPLGWLVVGWGLNRALARLTGLAAEIAARGAETKQPIPVAEVPVEVSPLVEAMNALLGRLQRSLDQQKQFVSDAAHELRTPLAALRLQIDALQLEPRRAALDSILPELGRGAGRASALVDQLLRLAKYEAGADQPASEDVDLVRLVLDCIADHVQIADSKQVDLGLVCADPARIAGSPTELRILVGNLIENAVRYTPPGGVVDVAIRVRGRQVDVEIADTGCGIRDEALPRVFDRFFRAAPADIEGTGLGLAICKAIAARHHVEIALANRQNGPGLVSTITAQVVADPADDARTRRVPA